MGRMRDGIILPIDGPAVSFLKRSPTVTQIGPTTTSVCGGSWLPEDNKGVSDSKEKVAFASDMATPDIRCFRK